MYESDTMVLVDGEQNETLVDVDFIQVNQKVSVDCCDQLCWLQGPSGQQNCADGRLCMSERAWKGEEEDDQGQKKMIERDQSRERSNKQASE